MDSDTHFVFELYFLDWICINFNENSSFDSS